RWDTTTGRARSEAPCGYCRPRIEHDVVWRRQFVAADLGVEGLCLTGFRVDLLNVAELVVRVGGNAHRVALDVLAAAVVAEVQRAVRPERQTVRAAAAAGKNAGLAVQRDSGQL